MSATLAELANHCHAELRGDPALQIVRVATLESAGPHDIAFVAGDKYSEQLASTHAGAVILAGENAKCFHGNILLNNNKAGIYFSGSPLEPYPSWLKNAVRMRQMDDMARRLKKVEQKVISFPEGEKVE